MDRIVRATAQGKASDKSSPAHSQLVAAEYRVVYEIDEEAKTVTVLDVDHRRDIYRRG